MKPLRMMLLLLLAIALVPSQEPPKHPPAAPGKAAKKKPPSKNDKPADCIVAFAGTSRKAVKLRTEADGTNYAKLNGGNVIAVSDWFKDTCNLDPQLPAKVPESQAMDKLETQVVTLKGFLMAAKLDPDNDIHTQIGGDDKWDSPQVVVEVPPGPDYCAARTKVWGLISNDAAPGSPGVEHVMKNPVPITVTGYVFLDAFHRRKGKAPCQDNGGRGIQKGGIDKVQGIWEIHPVLKAE